MKNFSSQIVHILCFLGGMLKFGGNIAMVFRRIAFLGVQDGTIIFMSLILKFIGSVSSILSL